MSYCRWSSDNWQSDVYAYESERGFEVHVASGRYVGDIPPLLPWTESGHDAWFERYQEQMAVVGELATEPIGGELDGQSFLYATLEECREGLLGIRGAGYHVPDYVFDMLQEEIAATAVTEETDG